MPAYAPELNLIEWFWAFIKKQVLGNVCARDLAHLRAKLTLGWQRVRRCGMVKNCFAKLFPASPSAPYQPPRRT